MGYWDKAEEAAIDARLLLREKRFTAATSRAYYAMFNAARALLQANGVEVENVKTHSGLAHLFAEHCVSQGMLDKSIGHFFRQAEHTRRFADYDTSIVSQQEAEERVEDMEKVLAAIGPILPGRPAK